MRIFECSRCHHAIFFENARCVHCEAILAYDFEQDKMLSLEPVENLSPNNFPALLYRSISDRHPYRLCQNNSEFGVCNSAIASQTAAQYCRACQLNELIPDLSIAGNHEAWQALEQAKRRLIYTLQQLGLPIIQTRDGLPTGLRFAFLADSNGQSKVITGHEAGLITLNIAEADAPFREKLRLDMGEGYRTLLGHFRHEIGHFYWDLLVRDSKWISGVRTLFGDERQDYSEALQRYYHQGPTADWQLNYISSYASMHPWEDWAETWAHYMHMIDTLETARSYGLTLEARVSIDAETLSTKPVAVQKADFKKLLDGWIPLTVAMNSLNRSMGLKDPYPFELTNPIIQKIQLIHQLINDPISS